MPMCDPHKLQLTVWRLVLVLVHWSMCVSPTGNASYNNVCTCHGIYISSYGDEESRASYSHPENKVFKEFTTNRLPGHGSRNICEIKYNVSLTFAVHSHRKLHTYDGSNLGWPPSCKPQIGDEMEHAEKRVIMLNGRPQDLGLQLMAKPCILL